MKLTRTIVVSASLATLLGCAPQLPTKPAEEQPEPAAERAEFRAIRLDEKNGTQVGSLDVAAASLSYVRGKKDVLGLSERDDLQVIGAGTSVAGLNHVRLQQTLEGVPVWGSDVVVHSSDTTFKSLNGNLTVGLKSFDVMPAIDAGTALFSAKADYATQAKGAAAPLAFERESSELVVFPTGNAGAKLAWRVEFFTELQNEIDPGLWNYFIDAKTGAILEKFNAIHTLSQASGPGGNGKTARTWNAALDVEASGSQWKMQTAKLLTVNMNNSQSGTGTIVTGPLNPIGDAAINDAHGFAELTLNMLQNWFGYNSIDNAGFVIKSRVHYGTNYENAFWDGTQMTYGDGASTFYALSGDIDVVSHEIHHGFTTKHSNLTYSGMSGGLNESFSDIAGTAAEFFAEGAGADWDVGADIFKSANGALRYMCTPSQDGASIDHASQYTNGMDVHYSSGVSNRAFCRAAKRLASGSPTGTATPDSVRRAAKAWFEANDNYWTTSTTFTQGCQGVIDAAAALGYSAAEITALRESWADTGVFCGGAAEPAPTCNQTLTAASGTITSQNYPANYPNNVNHTICIQPGAAATLTFSAFATEQGYDFVTIRDANGVQLSKTSGTTKPANATSTKLFVTFTSDSSVVATGWSASWSTGATTNQAPTVSLTSPANGATVSGTVTVSATAADADGTVAKVIFGLPNGTSVEDTTSPYSISWNTTNVADGANKTVTAKAVDNLGAQSASASRTVTVANGASCIGGTFNASGLPLAIPDNNATGITSNLVLSGAGNVGSLTFSMNASHTYQGDVKVTLVGPDGTQHVVHNRTGGSADNVVYGNVAITTFNGKAAAGTWMLKVQDLASADTGTLNSWSLNVTGNCSGTTPTGWTGSATPNLATVDNGSACTTLNVSATGNAADVKLDLAGSHAYRSVLRGTLTHNGVTVNAFPTATFPTGSGAFSLTARAVPGLSGDAAGSWQLCIIDTDAYGDTGVLNSWSVHN